jgi:hypothetical protein
MKSINEAQRALDVFRKLEELRSIEAREQSDVYGDPEYSVSSAKGAVMTISKASALDLLAAQITKLEIELQELGYDPHR